MSSKVDIVVYKKFFLPVFSKTSKACLTLDSDDNSTFTVILEFLS